MVDIFDTTESMVNPTLSSYFVTHALGLLFWGPLSEKFGRKPILLTGIGGYMLASIACAMSNDIEHLITARVLQAFAGSAITVVSTSVVKDLFDGRERERIMATIMSSISLHLWSLPYSAHSCRKLPRDSDVRHPCCLWCLCLHPSILL